MLASEHRSGNVRPVSKRINVPFWSEEQDAEFMRSKAGRSSRWEKLPASEEQRRRCRLPDGSVVDTSGLFPAAASPAANREFSVGKLRVWRIQDAALQVHWSDLFFRRLGGREDGEAALYAAKLAQCLHEVCSTGVAPLHARFQNCAWSRDRDCVWLTELQPSRASLRGSSARASWSALATLCSLDLLFLRAFLDWRYLYAWVCVHAASPRATPAPGTQEFAGARLLNFVRRLEQLPGAARDEGRASVAKRAMHDLRPDEPALEGQPHFDTFFAVLGAQILAFWEDHKQQLFLVLRSGNFKRQAQDARTVLLSEYAELRKQAIDDWKSKMYYLFARLSKSQPEHSRTTPPSLALDTDIASRSQLRWAPTSGADTRSSTQAGPDSLVTYELEGRNGQEQLLHMPRSLSLLLRTEGRALPPEEPSATETAPAEATRRAGDPSALRGDNPSEEASHVTSQVVLRARGVTSYGREGFAPAVALWRLAAAPVREIAASEIFARASARAEALVLQLERRNGTSAPSVELACPPPPPPLPADAALVPPAAADWDVISGCSAQHCRNDPARPPLAAPLTCLHWKGRARQGLLCLRPVWAYAAYLTVLIDPRSHARCHAYAGPAAPPVRLYPATQPEQAQVAPAECAEVLRQLFVAHSELLDALFFLSRSKEESRTGRLAPGTRVASRSDVARRGTILAAVRGEAGRYVAPSQMFYVVRLDNPTGPSSSASSSDAEQARRESSKLLKAMGSPGWLQAAVRNLGNFETVARRESLHVLPAGAGDPHSASPTPFGRFRVSRRAQLLRAAKGDGTATESLAMPSRGPPVAELKALWPEVTKNYAALVGKLRRAAHASAGDGALSITEHSPLPFSDANASEDFLLGRSWATRLFGAGWQQWHHRS
jgi:hypothetical protein